MLLIHCSRNLHFLPLLPLRHWLWPSWPRSWGRARGARRARPAESSAPTAKVAGSLARFLSPRQHPGKGLLGCLKRLKAAPGLVTARWGEGRPGRLARPVHASNASGSGYCPRRVS